MASEEVPSDLINRSQIGFREDAGLSPFNPQHPTLKSLPTVQHSICALNTSSPRLICKRCKGKLLRDSHSLICIYCGQCQAKDLPPETIIFKSTTGYRWLLKSLNLNPMETVGGFFEENRRNNAGTPVEDGKTLAELLDVQIAWRDELEEPETDFDGNRFLNFGKVGLDDFPTASGRDGGSDAYEEQPKNDQSDNFFGHGNLSLFQNVVPPEISQLSSDTNADASSGHDAGNQYAGDSKIDVISSDFSRGRLSGHDEGTQSVNSRTQNEDSKPVTAMSLGLSHDGSSERDGENQFVFPMEHNKNSKTAAMTNASFGHESDTEPMNSRTRNVVSKTATAIAVGLSHDGASEHDVENQSVLSTEHNKSSKTAAVTSAVSGNASSGHGAEINPVNHSTHNDAKLAVSSSDLSRDS